VCLWHTTKVGIPVVIVYTLVSDLKYAAVYI